MYNRLPGEFLIFKTDSPQAQDYRRAYLEANSRLMDARAAMHRVSHALKNNDRKQAYSSQQILNGFGRLAKDGFVRLQNRVNNDFIAPQ